MVHAVLPQLAEGESSPTILVVDDASPAGTGRIADRLAAEIAEVRVLHRPRKDGLGRAYLAGFAAALEGGADLILQMDCDFSHDPADLPRLILGVPVRDLTGGFKCWRRAALEALDLDGVDAHGYGFQIEMTYRAIKAGLTVTEVPIVFRERREGQSKMTAWITLEAVWKVPALRLRG